jgi:hypothetical protein
MTLDEARRVLGNLGAHPDYVRRNAARRFLQAAEECWATAGLDRGVVETSRPGTEASDSARYTDGNNRRT